MTAILTLLTIAGPALAQLDDFADVPTAAPRITTDVSREPAAALVIAPRKRVYPGGADEEDLSVQATLPDAEIKMDSRSIQRDVFKTVFNQELKEERHEDAEE